MKVTFLNPPYLPKFSREQRSPAVTKGGTLYYPFWLASAAGVVQEAGHRVHLLDAVAEDLTREATLNRVTGRSPGLVVVNTSTPSIYNDVAVARELKSRLPRAFLLLVGTHPSALPEETLALSKEIDGVAIGEYDFTVRDLAACLERGGDLSGVRGLCFRRGGELLKNPARELIADLDSLPFLSRVYKEHLNPFHYYFAAADYPMVMIITGRGCPNRCFYCLYPQVFHGRNYRFRSPENVAAEFAYISRELPRIREIGIEDDTFTVDKVRVRDICRLLIEQGNRLKWYANVRADLDYELMSLMRQAGCRLVTVGFESGDQVILNNMRKGLKLEGYRRFMRDARAAGMLVHGCIIAGNPGETRQTLEKSFRLARELNCDSMQFYPLIVYPGTEAYRWARKKGYLLTEDFSSWLTASHAHNCVVGFPDLSRGEIMRFCERAYARYHFHPRYLAGKLRQMLLRPSEGKRTLRSAFRYLRYLLRAAARKEQVGAPERGNA